MGNSERNPNRYWNSDKVESSQWDNLADNHEAEKRHELTNEQKKKIGTRLLDLMIKTELSYEEQSKILDALDKVYGTDTSSEAPSNETVEAATEETVEDNTETPETTTKEAAEEAVEEAVEEEVEAATEETVAEDAQEATAEEEDDNESKENINDYEPLNLEEAETSGKSTLDIDSVKEALREKHSEVADIAISLLEHWNDNLSHEDRLNILRGNATKNQAGLVRILTEAGLIEITTNNGKSSESLTQSEETESNETESSNEDNEARNKLARMFYYNRSRWLYDTDPSKNWKELIDNPDEYSLEKLQALEQQYETDRKELFNKIISNDELMNWYTGKAGSKAAENLANMSYDELYELNADYDRLIRSKAAAEMFEKDKETYEPTFTSEVETFSNDEQKMFYFEHTHPSFKLERGSYFKTFMSYEEGVEEMKFLNLEYDIERRALGDSLKRNANFSNWYISLAEGNSLDDLTNMGYKDLFELNQQFEQSSQESTPESSTNEIAEPNIESTSDEAIESSKESSAEDDAEDAEEEEEDEEGGLDFDPLSADTLNDSETTTEDVVKFMDGALQKIKELLGPDRIAKITSAIEKFKSMKGALKSWRALLTLPKEELSEANQDMLDTLEGYGVLEPQTEEAVAEEAAAENTDATTSAEASTEEAEETTAEDDAEQLERPHITPITSFSIKQMSPNRMREHMNSSFQKLEGFLSPDDASRLKDAVDAWNNNFSNSQRKGILNRPLKKYGPDKIAVLQTLEEFGLLERIDAESVAAEDAAAEEVDTSSPAEASVEATAAEETTEEVAEEAAAVEEAAAEEASAENVDTNTAPAEAGTETSATDASAEATEETAAQTAENNTEQRAERPRIRAITLNAIEGTTHPKITKQMNNSFKKLKEFLTPDEASRLEDAVNTWNSLKDNQQKAFMKYSVEGFSTKHQSMIETLEEFGLLERADTATRAAAKAAEANAEETVEEVAEETAEEAAEETTEEASVEQSAERPRITPLTVDMVKRMRGVDINRQVTRSYDRIKSFLSPDEASKLDSAVKSWTELSENQQRVFMTRPLSEFNKNNQDMLKALEDANIIQRAE